MWLWIILAALAIYVLKYFAWVAKYPKGPRPLPFIGNCLQLDPKNVYKNFADFGKQYGSVFTVFTPEPIVVLSDYEAVKDAFVYHGDDFSGRPRNKFMELFEIQRNGGILSSVGENWRDQRRTALNALRDLGMGKNVMEEKVKHSIREYLKELEQLPDKDDVDFTWPLQFMVCGVIFDTIFGKYDRHDEELDEFLHKFHKYTKDVLESRLIFVANQFPWIVNVPILGYYAFGRMKGYTTELNQYTIKLMKQSLERFDPDAEPECFVHAYMCKSLQSKNPALNEDQLLCCCNDLFFAALDTTTTTLRWGMIFLANNIAVQENLRSELLSVVGPDRLPSVANKPNLPYLVATVYEIQRKANIMPINIPHETTNDTVVLGMKVPAGTNVNADLHNILANDPLFVDSDEFRPERFLNTDGKTLNKEATERCIPFSLGRRQCAGESLARMELLLAVASTVLKFRLQPAGSQAVASEEPVTHFSVHPREDVRLRITPVLA